jgi:hypothetical protein
MARWRLRDPGSFPPGFHAAMLAGEGVDKVVTQRYTLAAARSDQEDWRLFRFCLRHNDNSTAATFERKLMHRTRIAWNKDAHVWELLLTSRPTVMEDLVEMG